MNTTNNTNLEKYFNAIVGRCFRYSDGLVYPHGRAVSIKPYRYFGEEVINGYRQSAVICCMISFSDGYIGDFTFNANVGTYNTFKTLQTF